MQMSKILEADDLFREYSSRKSNAGPLAAARASRTYGEAVMATSKCPVCDWDLKDDAKSVKVDGKTVRVCCDDCAAKVKANPKKYSK